MIFDLAFIDGLHLFEQVLRDFINVERHCSPNAVVAFHDTLPVSAAAAGREEVPGLWCGDVWRILPCLRKWRPDLGLATIPTGPSGLTVATRLDPASRVLDAHYDAIVDECAGLPYGWLEAHLTELIATHDNSASTLARILSAGRAAAAKG
ncbi:MAG: class I SAM-dependent methyltransferase [Pseudomonadota bacterium]